VNGQSAYFDRIRGQINVPLLATKHVVVVGVGTVGSPVAEHLAKDGAGSFLFIDGDTYEEVNRVRHVLPPTYLGKNKAEAMRDYLLSERIPGLNTQALPYFVENSMSDAELDVILDPAHLIIAGTGEREIQRRIGRRALALDIPAIFPMLYLDGGGEVFIQTSPQSPCFFCMDGFRRGGDPVRGAEALGVEAMPVIQTAIELSLGLLDEDSRYGGLTLPKPDDPDQRRYQHFILLPEAARRALPIEWRRDCPSCAVGPSPLRQEATEAWRAAESAREAEISEPPSVSTSLSSDRDEQPWERPAGRTVTRIAGIAPPYTPPQLQHLPFIGSPAIPDRSVTVDSSKSANRQRRVNRVLLTVCAAIIVALLIAIVSTDSRPPAEISAPVSVKMDYSQSLPTMIKASHLQVIENDVSITEAQFPVTSGSAQVKVALIRLTHFSDLQASGVHESAHYQATYNEVLDKLSQLGYRPATLPELLAFVAQDAEMRGLSMVELAGPSYLEKDVTCEVSQEYLRCGSVADGFDQASEFVAVQK
jgi:ThiF family